ncbi:MAG: caspase family protein [Pseudomonadota bacterium]
MADLSSHRMAMSVIDRVVDMFPPWLLIAAGAVLGSAWLVKTLTRAPDYGAVLRQRGFQFSLLVICVVSAAYVVSTLPKRFPNGQPVVVVTTFEGDSEQQVQRHTYESLLSAIGPELDEYGVKVATTDQVVADADDANEVIASRGAQGVVAGSVISDSLVWYRIYWRDAPKTTIAINSFPDIDPVTQQFVTTLSAMSARRNEPIRSQRKPERVKGKALIIANHEYPFGRDFPDILVDVRNIRSVFGSMSVGTRLLENGSKREIEEAISAFLSGKHEVGENLYIYYSGLGTTGDLAPAIIPSDVPLADGEQGPAFVEINSIISEASSVNDANVFLIFDTNFGKLPVLSAQNTSIIFAGNAGELVFGTPEEGGRLTSQIHRFVREQSLNGGGEILFDDLAESVSLTVHRASDGKQKPFFFSSGEKVFGVTVSLEDP